MHAIPLRAVWLVVLSLSGGAQADDAAALRLGPGWVVVGTQHVRDSAEKDLAVLDADRPLAALRICAQERPVRLRNATAWMPRDQRQKLWLPLVINAGACSKPIRVQRGPQRVTHIAFDYEALSADWAGARIVIAGQPAAEPR
jgi:hypothetical protein